MLVKKLKIKLTILKILVLLTCFIFTGNFMLSLKSGFYLKPKRVKVWKVINDENYDSHLDLIQKARTQSNCITPKNTTYIVCESLPFTKIECGKDISLKTKDAANYVVPNIVHFIWFGNILELNHFYQYLSLRSVASLQHPDAIYIHHNMARNISGKGSVLNRIIKEIPCLHFIEYQEPLTVFNNQISTHLLRSDVARLQILLRQGGAYLDLDVITLKSYNPLRVYSTTFGRSVSNKISNGVILSEIKSPFIETWYKEYKYYKEGVKPYAYWGVNVPMQLYRQQLHLRVHMEETSINRPNPWVDGWDATSTAHLDLTDNYFLHVHPSYFVDKEGDLGMMDWEEQRLRTLDAVYGTAARIALFGAPELVFLQGENTFEMWPKRKFRSFDPIKIEDIDA